MAIETRNYVWCSLGSLSPTTPVTLAEDHIQGRGLCTVKGTVTLSGIHNPVAGAPLALAYSDGQSFIARVPFRLRVLSSSADPLRRITTVSVGCLLTLFENRRPPAENPKEITENASVPDVVRRVAATPMSASWVVGQILTTLGLTAAGSVPFEFHRIVDEWDLSSGYVEELGRICQSARYFCRINEAEQVEFVPKDDGASGVAPLITAGQIIDMTPVNVGELPGDAIYARFTSLKLVPPDSGLDENEVARRNWEREQAIGGAVQSIHSYTDAGGLLVKQEIVYNDWSETITTYDGKDRVTKREERSNTLNGPTLTVTKFSYGSGETGAEDDLTDVREEITEEYGPIGDIAAACGKNGPHAVFTGGTMLKGWRITTYDKNKPSGITKTTTQQVVCYINTPFGSDAIAKLREEGEPVDDLINRASRKVPYGSSTRIRTERQFGLQRRPGQQERNQQALEKVPTVEQVATIAWQTGSPTSQTAVELSPPYVSDDRIVATGSPPTYSVVPSGAQEQALAYARIENRLLLGNRNGRGLQLAPIDAPARPYQRFFVRLNNCTAEYRANGSTWTLGADGVAVTTDALFWGAIDGTVAEAWFPLPPGQTTLPTAGTVATNANPKPPNAIPIPAGFNPQAPDLAALFAALPTGVAGVPRATLNPAGPVVPPWRETLDTIGGVRVGAVVTLQTWLPLSLAAEGGVRVGAEATPVDLLLTAARGTGRAGTLQITRTDPPRILQILPARGVGRGMLITSSVAVNAGLVLVPNRAALFADDFINWAVLGPEPNEVPQPVDGTTTPALITNEGFAAGAQMLASNPFRRRDQGPVQGEPPNQTGFEGDFALGAPLLWTNRRLNQDNPLTLTLPAGGVAAVGTQISPEAPGVFQVKIEAFDASDNPLGPSFTLQGDAQSRQDNSALFIGLRSNDPSQAIEKFVITVTSAASLRANFLINQVDFSSNFSP